MTYETALQKLEELTEALQEGTLSIDEMQERLTEAAELIRFCRTKLRETETLAEGLFDQE